MALSLLEAQERMRRAMLRRDAQTLRELTEAYRSAYRFIKRDADRLLDRIARAQVVGESVSPFWLFQEERYRSLLIQIQRRINTFADRASGKITAAQSDLVAMGSKDALRLIGLSAPELAASFDLLPARALENLIGVLSDGSPLSDLLGELGQEAREMVSRTLFEGLASGMPIRKMAKGIQDALGGNLTRALNISRTESLRAYRESSRETYLANQDVVKGWRWVCSFSSRTCAMCLAMHGTEHDNSETFASHPQCRCSPVPITKTFRELGIPVDQPRPDFGDADKWIRSQPLAVQQGIFGKTGAAAFRSGRINLQDFVGERTDSRWGQARYVRPIGEILTTPRRRAA